MKTRNEILDVIRGLMPEFKTHYNVKRIGLFGSALRGEQGPASDIDLLVEFQSPIGLFKFLELEELLAERLGAKVDLVSKKALKPEIGRAILSEVVMA
jgi:predicted nucleotidyltransferase